MSEFDDLIQSISKEIKNEPYGHSEFQIRNFIIGSQPTEYGKYKQCVLELRSRAKNYNILVEKYDKLRTKESLSTEEIKQVAEYEILLEDIKRETYIINDLYQEIKENIDLSDRDSLEIDYWDTKFSKEIFAHRLANCPISVSLIQNVMSLPDNCRSKGIITNQIKDRIQQAEDMSKKELKNGPKRHLADRSS